jgi:hypothetical protein
MLNLNIPNISIRNNNMNISAIKFKQCNYKINLIVGLSESYFKLESKLTSNFI